MARRTTRNKKVAEESKNEVDDDHMEENGDSSDSSDEEMEAPELMVTSRTRRDGAGAKMQVLLNSANMEDDFYKDAYGGAFNEDDQDDIFQSPVHSDDDVVDSDFDKSEEEDEPVSGDETKEGAPRRSMRVKRKEDTDDRKKKWVIARMGGACVAANVVDERRHEKLLKEAEETERINVESLKKYEEFELEKKKKREKATMTKNLIGPRIIERDNEEGKVVIHPFLKKFSGARRPEGLVCAVTGRPARYTDPVTGLPYSSKLAFKVIRDKYYKYLRTVRNREDVNELLATIE